MRILGRAQMLNWEDEGTTFKMYIMVESDKKHETAPIPKEEIFKIAESFERYE